MALGASPVWAQTVGNPGPFNLTSTGGSLDLENELWEGSFFAPPYTLSAAGTIDADGDIAVPATGFSFPEIDLPSSSGLNPTITSGYIQLSAAGPVTGTLDPAGGSASLVVPLQYEAQIVGSVNLTFGELDFVITCNVGEAVPAVTLQLTTGTTSPPEPQTPLVGVPYDQAAGTLTLVASGFTIPAPVEADCELFGDSLLLTAFDAWFGVLVGQLQLPSDENAITIEAALDPVIRAPGYVPPSPPPPPPPPAAVVLDTIPPGVTLAAAARVKLKAVLRRGYAFQATCSEACALLAQLRLAPRLAKRLKLPEVVGQAVKPLGAGQATGVAIKLKAKAKRKFNKMRKVVLQLVTTATDSTANASTVKKKVVLRR